MRGLKVAVIAGLIFFCCMIPLGAYFLDSPLFEAGNLPTEPVTASYTTPGSSRPIDLPKKSIPSATISQIPVTYSMPAITDTPSTVGFATVIVENANLRAGPGINYAVTGYVKMGDQLFVYGQNEDGKWFQLDRDGKMWIKASLVEKATQTPKSISGPSEAENTPIIETSPTSTPDYLIIDVTTLIGTPVAQVEQMLGQAILVTPNNDQSDTLAGGEFRDYMIGKYRACLSFDKNGIARGFQVLEGLIEDDYSLSDWREILPRFGINLPVEPDKTARVALYWYNYNGYGIIISANNMSGRPVWSVQIDEAAIFQR